MAGPVLIRETKGKGGVALVGRRVGWGGVSVQCVEIGRPELVGGKASKAGAQPPHSHQLWGDVAPAKQSQRRSPAVSVSAATESSFQQKQPPTSCISAQPPLGRRQNCERERENNKKNATECGIEVSGPPAGSSRTKCCFII